MVSVSVSVKKNRCEFDNVNCIFANFGLVMLIPGKFESWDLN